MARPLGFTPDEALALGGFKKEPKHTAWKHHAPLTGGIVPKQPATRDLQNHQCQINAKSFGSVASSLIDLGVSLAH